MMGNQVLSQDQSHDYLQSLSRNLSQYRNLTQLSEEEWQSLDIYIFIAANFNRYCAPLIKKIGAKYLPSDASDSLLSLFCDVGYKPLASIHRKNLDARGERRNQIMLGTLKMIATTRMVEAVIREFPSYVTLDLLPETSENDYHKSVVEEEYLQPLQTESWQQALYAASDDCVCHEEAEAEADMNDEHLSLMVESIRSYLTPMQYKHLRFAVCEGLSCNEIADKTGHSATNVRIMLLNARKKMMELIPTHLNQEFADCLHRR